MRTRTPRRDSACPSSSPITPDPNTAQDSQVLPVEQVVVDDDAVAEPLQLGGTVGPRPGGDDEPLRFDAIAAIDLERMVVEKADPPADPRVGGPGLDGVHHEPDEAIP